MKIPNPLSSLQRHREEAASTIQKAVRWLQARRMQAVGEAGVVMSPLARGRTRERTVERGMASVAQLRKQETAEFTQIQRQWEEGLKHEVDRQIQAREEELAKAETQRQANRAHRQRRAMQRFAVCAPCLPPARFLCALCAASGRVQPMGTLWPPIGASSVPRYVLRAPLVPHGVRHYVPPLCLKGPQRNARSRPLTTRLGGTLGSVQFIKSLEGGGNPSPPNTPALTLPPTAFPATSNRPPQPLSHPL